MNAFRVIILLFSFQFSFLIYCPAQVITTIGGNGVNGYSGDGGPATNAEIAGPYSIVLDNSGNIYIADGVIRKINTSGIVSTVAGIGIFGYSGDGGPATAAEVAARGVAIDKTGNIFIADMENNVVRKVNTAGVISTYAGNGYRAGSGLGGYSGDGGPATAAEFFFPEAVACDKYGNIFVADTWNQVIRKIDTMGIISTIGGNGFGSGSNFGGYSGDGGPATNAEFNQPCSVATDDTGNIFIADYDNLRIRKINTSGIINTVAGENAVGYSGDGGTATSAELSYPTGIAVYDTIYLIADMGNDRVRKVNSSGIINTIAGIGSGTYSGDGGLATAAELWGPYDAIADSSGNILIADSYNNRVRKIWMSLKVSANVVTQVNCYGDITASASVVASDGISPYTYSWFPNGGSDTFATGLSAGIYTVFVTDSNNIKGSATIIITQPSAIGILASVNTNISCNGGNNGSASSIVSGGTVPYTYLWSDASSQTTVSATGLLAGIYTLTVTDNNGCTTSTMVSISQPAAIIPSIMEYSGIKCNGDSDAVIFADATGGSGFYAYSWSDASSQATALATGLSVGNYTITVTDNNGCSGTSSTTITQPSVLNVVADSINEIGGSCNGSAWVMVTGGTPLYTYLWTGGLTTDTIRNQCTGNYCSTVTDANGCMDSVCVNIDVSTGINNIINSPEIIIYPNPTSSNFTVELSNINGACNLELFNILGKKISSTELKTNTTNIDMSSEAEGVYLYRFIDKGGITIETGKIVVLR